MNIKQQPMQTGGGLQPSPIQNTNTVNVSTTATAAAANVTTAQMHHHHQQQQLQQQSNQSTHEMEQKKLQDILESLSLIGTIRDDINVILENVAKSNTANSVNNQTNKSTNANSVSALASASASTASTNNSADTTNESVSSVSMVVLTPASVTNNNAQSSTDPSESTSSSNLFLSNNINNNNNNRQNVNGADLTNGSNGDFKMSNDIDLYKEEQQAFLAKTNIKFLQDKIMDINKNFM
jgi:hypothetical protein